MTKTPAKTSVTVGMRLRTARLAAGYMTASALAKAVDTRSGNIRSWETDARGISVNQAQMLAPVIRRPWYWLLYGEHPNADQQRLIEVIEAQRRGQPPDNGEMRFELAGRVYCRVPLRDLAAPDDAPDWDVLRLDWLDQLGRPCDGVSLWRAADDMMAKSIGLGDVVAVDQSITVAAASGVYLLRIGAERLIRRVALHPTTSRLTVTGDNPHCPKFEGLDPRKLTVEGRAFWVSRSIR